MIHDYRTRLRNNPSWINQCTNGILRRRKTLHAPAKTHLDEHNWQLSTYNECNILTVFLFVSKIWCVLIASHIYTMQHPISKLCSKCIGWLRPDRQTDMASLFHVRLIMPRFYIYSSHKCLLDTRIYVSEYFYAKRKDDVKMISGPKIMMANGEQTFTIRCCWMLEGSLSGRPTVECASSTSANGIWYYEFTITHTFGSTLTINRLLGVYVCVNVCICHWFNKQKATATATAKSHSCMRV